MHRILTILIGEKLEVRYLSQSDFLSPFFFPPLLFTKKGIFFLGHTAVPRCAAGGGVGASPSLHVPISRLARNSFG